jgi:hypothetical protein
VSDSVTPIQSVTLEPSEYRITVGIQEMAYISRHSLHLSFVDVTEDSRCAIGVQCPWEGRATIRLVVGGGPSGTNPNEWRELTIPGAATTDYFGYTITLLELRPYPGESTPAAYEATLLVTPPE